MAQANVEAVISVKDQATAALSSIAGKFGVLAGAIGGAVGLTAFLKASSDKAAEFNVQLQKAGFNAKATASEMQDMQKAIFDASLKTGISITEAADAMQLLAGGGVNAKAASEALGEVLKIKMIDPTLQTTEVVKLMTDAIVLFGIEAENTGKVTDILTIATSQSLQTMPEFVSALGQVAGQAKQAGLSIEEAAGFIDFFADSGVRGTEGGIAISNILQRLMVPASDDAREKMQELGVSIFDAAGNAKPMGAVLLDLRDKFQAMSAEQQLNSAQMIFGTRSARDWLILIQEGTKSLEQYIAEQQGAAGASADLVSAIESAQSPFEKLSVGVEILQQQVGSALNPEIEKLFKVLLTPENIQMISNLFVGAVKLATGVVTLWSDMFKVLHMWFVNLGVKFLEFKDWIQTYIVDPINVAITKVAAFIEMIKSIPGKIGGFVSGAFNSVGNALGFQEGGVVPGSPGQPQLAVVHGGERVIPVNASTRAGGSSISVTITGNNIASDLDMRDMARIVGEEIMRRLRFAQQI